jgi:hypothetical protein
MIRKRVAGWLVVRLSDKDSEGDFHPPGSGVGIRLREPDGREVAVISRGDGFDLYFAGREVYCMTLVPRNAVRLAFWLVWWWIRHAWFGVRIWLWVRMLGVVIDRRMRVR